MNLIDLLPLALLGGVLGLDVVSFPQAMISRPLVAATLGGALVGEAVAGLVAGVVLELIAIETLPFGASRYPEWGSAAVVGGALFAVHPENPAGALVVAAMGALATAWVGGWTMVKLRRRNAVWATRFRDRIDAGSREAVVGLQLTGLTADFVRGALLTAVAYAVLAPLTLLLLGEWTVAPRLSRAIVCGTAASVTGGAVWKIFHATPGARWLLMGGFAVGLGILVAR